MGRILHKKVSPKKKKKSDSGTESPANAETAAEGSPAAITADKEASRKQAAAQRKPLPAVKPPPSGAANFLEKSLQFLREVKVELKKVTWPSRKQTLGSTVVVIVLVMIISLFLGVVDIGLSNLIRLVF